jgi:hypothetical protein
MSKNSVNVLICHHDKGLHLINLFELQPIHVTAKLTALSSFASYNKQLF